MSTGPGPTAAEALPLSLAYLIDERCDRFEAAFRAGGRPGIEDELAAVPEPARPALLRELLALELALRRSDGERPTLEEYRARFPRDVAQVDAAYAAVPVPPTEETRTITLFGGNPGALQRPAGADRYRILQLHAKGGLGEVYVARDTELNRDVALKQIRDGYARDSWSRARFLLEAEITGGLEHPGIVPIYSLGQAADGRLYYAMRFIQGMSLHEAIARFHGARDQARPAAGSRSLEFRKLVARFVDVCDALAYAHSRGVLHRDIKPANIMLGLYGETLVVDWGLAKPREPSGGEDAAAGTLPPLTPASASGTPQTMPGSAIGTPAYMSPEQAAGRVAELGPASDVYGLGATFYHLLTGRSPFQDRDVATVLEKVLRGEFPPPRQLNREAPAALEAICLKAMARAPRDRYASARALADDIEHWLADEPVAAYREPAGARLARWARRHRPAVAGAGALLVSAVVALAISTVLIDRERAHKEHQRQLAERNFAHARAAVDQMLTEVGQVELADVPQMGAARARLLEKARRLYLAFLEQKAGDPALWMEAARASLRLAEIRQWQGDHVEAERAYRRALVLLRRPAGRAPTPPAFRAERARALSGLGMLLKKGNRFREAEAAFREALRIQQGLVARAPGDLIYRNALAESQYHLGALLARLRNRRPEDEDAYRAALDIQRRLVAAGGGGREARLRLARSLNNLGILLADTGRFGDAEARYREGLRLLEELAAQGSDTPGSRWQRARCSANLGVLRHATGRTAEAETALQRARDLLERLAADFPDVPDYRQELASVHNNLGLVWQDLGRRDEAVAAYRRALELREALVAGFPGVPDYRQRMAVTRLNLAGALEAGDPAKAEAAYRAALAAQEGLAARSPDVAEYQVALGRTQDRLARFLADPARGGAAEARRLLEHAVPRLRSALESDPRDWSCRGFLRDAEAALALVLIQAGEYPRAAAAAEELPTILPDDLPEYLRAAALLARCAAAEPRPDRGEGFARRAVAQLRRALDRGVLRDARRLDLPEFEGLRARDDFLRLRDEIRKARGAFG